MPRPGHRPLSTYRAFGVFVALWSAALLGLVVFVLPDAVVTRAVAAVGLAPLLEESGATHQAIRIGASAVAALIGALLGLLALRLAGRRKGYDPRPVFADDEIYTAEQDETPQPVRRPLHIREELPQGISEERREDWAEEAEFEEVVEEPEGETGNDYSAPVVDESRTVLAQDNPTASAPASSPAPGGDLASLLEKFDRALERYQEGGSAPSQSNPIPLDDPLHAFLAKQAGAESQAKSPAPEPFDHQAELRLALDKLVRSRSKD